MYVHQGNQISDLLTDYAMALLKEMGVAATSKDHAGAGAGAGTAADAGTGAGGGAGAVRWLGVGWRGVGILNSH